MKNYHELKNKGNVNCLLDRSSFMTLDNFERRLSAVVSANGVCFTFILASTLKCYTHW